MELFSAIVNESVRVLVEAAPYMLFGFLVAGLMKGFIPDSLMARHLGGNSPLAVLKAAIIGVPIPLCSCGVIPAAVGLRRQGASRGAATAFMISTPETGVDSIAVTYALIDPIMTVVRPVAATITALTAGLLVNAFPDRDQPEPVDDAACTEHDHGGCGCSGGCCVQPADTFFSKLSTGLRFAFGEMIQDVGSWFLVGVVVAGLIGALVPQDFVGAHMGNRFGSYLIMLVVALPLYVCATSSTPIAASLLIKGLSPGAALVFLLAGPATNGATLTVLFKSLGKRAAAMYLLAIVVCSLALAWAVDVLYARLGLDIHAVVLAGDDLLPEWVGVIAAVVLVVLVLKGYAGRLLRRS